jgi:hypothetical protein
MAMFIMVITVLLIILLIALLVLAFMHVIVYRCKHNFWLN